MQTETLILGLVWYGVFLFSVTLHEAGHAFAALKLGDPTAYMGGQVTLDPTPHVRREPVGMILVPIVSFVLLKGQWMIGWASAPYDPLWAHQHPKRSAVMAAAGPAANLLIVLVAGLVIRGGVFVGHFHPPVKITFTEVTTTAAPGQAVEMGPGMALAIILSILFSLNLVLFLFNLFPLPPLDGSSVITLFMDDTTAQRFQAWVRQPAFSLLGLIVAWHLFPRVFGPVHLFALNVLYYPIANYH